MHRVTREHDQRQLALELPVYDALHVAGDQLAQGTAR
jgi:hypothetical protein